MATRWWLIVLGALLPGILSVAPAAAHEMRPATLALRDLGGGAVQFEWNPPLGRPGDARRVVPEFPPGCVPVSPNRLQCAAGELAGELRIAGLRGRPVQVFVQLETKEGGRHTAVLDARRDRMQLGADASSEMEGVAPVYFVLGVEHILGGFDHLLFVVGLALLVGFTRRLVATVTGFTVAHSLTLALSVLDLVRVPIAAVEALIALSIVLTAAEVLSRRPTVVRRLPWLVSFAFGLLHGLGFASALQEIGLPAGQLFTALLSFNLGVEAGQLAVIAVGFAAARGLRRSLPARILRRGAAYGIGSLAAYWFVERMVAIVA